jgi:Uma2 family endonuclease
MGQSYSGASGYSVDAYRRLVDDGVVSADDHVELLDGVIVAEPPQDPPRAASTCYAADAIRRTVGTIAVVRVQMPFIAGECSVPEPDVAVVPGVAADYEARHPDRSWLIIEVARSSLPQDRLSKSRIYAGASVPEYWIVNLRDDCVEVFRGPDQAARVYHTHSVAHRGQRLPVPWVSGDRACRRAAAFPSALSLSLGRSPTGIPRAEGSGSFARQFMERLVLLSPPRPNCRVRQPQALRLRLRTV